MASDPIPNQPEKVRKSFYNEPTGLQPATYLSFEWSCNNLSCNYQKLINSVSMVYAGADLELIQQKIPAILQQLAQFTGADHIGVCESRNNYKTIAGYYEWNSEDVEFSHGNSGKVTTANLLKSYYPVHKQGKLIYIPSVDLPPDGFSNLATLMLSHGIRSLISIPLTYNNDLIGTLELYYLSSTTAFQERELYMLRYFAELQSNVIQRIFNHAKWLDDADKYLNRQSDYEKELKTAREHAEAARKTKDTFFVNLSHEIRTPLNIITGMHRELMREKLTSRQRNFLQQSSIASRYLLNLFNNVMDINDMETGAFHLNQKDFNLRLLMLEVKEMLTGKAMEKKSIDFQFIISESLHTAYRGDAQRLQQILVKLISNAFKFTNEGVIRVEVNVRRKTKGFHELFFEISDTGIGMSNGFRTVVFDKFSREDDSMTRIHEGAGLGLYICYRLATLMGGNIRVESEQGVGTQIQLTLPLQLGDEKTLEAKLSQSAGYNFKDIRILLVEDNDTNRFIARQTLELTGCQLTEAVNGQEAVSLLRDHNFDLILMDIQMPVMNGMIATKIIRDELKLKLPIIAFTANAIDSEIAKYLSCGMEDYIVKPYRETELYQKINKYTQKEGENKAKIQIEEKLFDLSYLNELSQGDETFTRQIIETFIIMAEQSIEQLTTALYDKDIAAIRKIAHKIKPTLANFQINSIKAMIESLNHIDADTLNTEELQTDIDKLIDVLTTVQTQLKVHIQ